MIKLFFNEYISKISIVLFVFFILSFALSGCYTTPDKEAESEQPKTTESVSSNTTSATSQEIAPAEKENYIDISSDEYFDLIEEVFTSATKNNDYYVYGGYHTRFPYIQLYIKPKDNYSIEITKEQSTELIKNVLSELKKYQYKSGGIFRYNYEYLNVYFYGYNEDGEYYYNAGPYIQIDINNIQNISESNLTF